MSTPKELRERFRSKSSQEEHTPSGTRVQMADILGLTAEDMHNIIVDDIAGMIDKGYRPAMEGYILCLSRIMSHDKAWKSIIEAFHQKSEKVPSKYYSQFGQTKEQINTKGGMMVK